MDESRVVEIYSPTECQAGSGYLVAGNLVLTAYHVAHKNIRNPRGALRIRMLGAVRSGSKKWYDAEIVWPPSPPDVHRDRLSDVAVLRVVDDTWDPLTLEPIRWGAVTGGERVESVAVGFPDAEARPDRVRDTMPVRGSIEPYHSMKSGLLTVHVTGIVPRKGGWHGMSGAALFCGATLTGVVVIDHDISDRAEVLYAAPVGELMGEPGFAELLREDGPPVVQPVTASAPHRAPSAAEGLRHYPPSPPPPAPPGFVGREKELDRALRLVADGRIIPVVGPEHVGKTAFITQLLRKREFEQALPGHLPWMILDLSLPSGRGSYPVSRRLATLLGADLFGLEQYTEGETGSAAAKRAFLLDQVLAGGVRNHALIAVIDCAMVEPFVDHLVPDLDALLASPVFRRSVSFVASSAKLAVDGQQQLRRMPAIRLGSLTDEEAVELLSAALDDFGIEVDAAAAIAEANDDIARRPKVLLMGAERYADRDLDETDTADPLAVAYELLEACHITITSAFDDADCRVTRDGAAGPLSPLIVWSLARHLPLPETLLLEIGLDRDMVAHLVRAGVLVRETHTPAVPGSDAQSLYGLGRATQEALRNLVLTSLGRARPQGSREAELAVLLHCADDAAELDRVLAQGAAALYVAGFAYADGDQGDGAHAAFSRAIEDALGWLDRQLPKDLPRLRKQLEDFALMDTAELFPAVEPEERQATSSRLVQQAAGPALPPETAALANLYSTVADINLVMREPQTPAATERFVATSRLTAEAIGACISDIPTQLLRAVDNALHIGTHRFGCHAEIVGIREGAIPLLEEQATRRTPGKVGRLVWTVSWVLNTAEMRLDLGQDAAEYLETVGRLLSELPEPDTLKGELTSLALRVRAGRARARAASSEEERSSALEAAWEFSRTGLLRSASFAEQIHQLHLWTRRFLDAAKQYAFELRLDDERVAVVEAVKRALDDAYGSRETWPLAMRLAVTRFLRSVSRRQADPALQLEGAEEASACLIGHEAELLSQAAAGLGAGLVELGQTLGFRSWALAENGRLREAVAVVQRAESHAEYAVRHSPSAHAYRTWLQLLRQREEWDSPAAGAEDRVLPEFRQAVIRTMKWLKEQKATSLDHALLDLWCIEEGWHRQGRSLYAAAESMTPGRGFRIDDLRRAYKERMRYLRGHDKRYGAIIEAFLLRADLEREYRRLLAVKSPSVSSVVDKAPVWAVYQKAEELWPRSNRIRLAKARMHRYTWEYDEAVEVLETVIRSARNGHTRRQAQILASEALLLHAYYDLPSGGARELALRRAADHLREPLGHQFFRQRVAVLSECIRLELDEPVNWAGINATFDELIGDEYAATIGRYLQDARARRGEAAGEGEGYPAEKIQGITDLLYEDFTNEELINGLGQLYLRKARLVIGSDAPTSADRRAAAIELTRRAYDCFDACRVLLEAWSGEEYLVNRFQRAESILCAVTLANDIDPFPWSPEKKPSWLKLAVDLYQSCQARSVGKFHDICKQRLSASHKLLNDLSN